VRALVAVAELLALALVPSLVIVFLSPLVGQRFALADIFVGGFCLFVGGLTFYSLATYLATIFPDLWRPLAIACAAAMGVAFVPELVPGTSMFALFHVMSAEGYFRGGGAPWAGLLASALVSLSLLFLAEHNFARRDF
jgi:hypothetical protein